MSLDSVAHEENFNRQYILAAPKSYSFQPAKELYSGSTDFLSPNRVAYHPHHEDPKDLYSTKSPLLSEGYQKQNLLYSPDKQSLYF
jgi:hypothetical protein